MSEDPRGEWERHARWWQENFTDGADPEYEELILPLVTGHLEHLAGERSPGAPRILEVGAGEGQVARAVRERTAATVVGLDSSRPQLEVAAARGGGVRPVAGDATALPFPDASIDAAVVCLLLEHVAELDSALAELSRVLRPGGTLVVVLNHPMVATPGSGWVHDHLVDPPEQYWQLGPYLREGPSVEKVGRGVELTFHHRPLSRYLNAARGVALVLEHMDEPPPPPSFVALTPEIADQESMPRMMVLRFGRVVA